MNSWSRSVHIGVFGATGTIGGAVVAEALARGHRVTAFTRRPSRIPADPGPVTWKIADPTDLDSVAAVLDGLDVLVNAINAGDTIADQIANAAVLPAAARTLLKALERRPAARLIVVGGGGTLEVEPGVRLLDTGEDFTELLTEVLDVPAEYRDVVQAQADVLALCRLSDRQWTYLTPDAGRIHSGERTGRYRLGGDRLMPAAPDAGDLSAEDLAVALVDEIEVPRHLQRRFAVGN